MSLDLIVNPIEYVTTGIINDLMAGGRNANRLLKDLVDFGDATGDPLGPLSNLIGKLKDKIQVEDKKNMMLEMIQELMNQLKFQNF